MLLLLLSRQGTTTAIRRHSTGAGAAVSNAVGTAESRRYSPIAVYTMTVIDQNTQYINLDREGT